MRATFSAGTGALLIFLVLFCGCFGKPTALSLKNEGSCDMNSFAFDVYGELAGEEENIFFSPLSILAAFGIVYTGAEGETASEMRDVLGFKPGDVAGPAFRALMDSLTEKEKENVFKLDIANALWAREGFRVKKEFIEASKKYFDAGVQTLDFSDPALAAGRINAWVSDKTSGKITDLIHAESIDDLTRLIITNAVYFTGAWETPFQKEETSPGDFFVRGVDKTEVLMMRGQAIFGYAEAEGVKILEMPYEESGLSMVLLLPREKTGLAGLEQNLSPETLNDFIGRTRRVPVEAVIPLFELDASFDLAEIMKNLGVLSAFDPGKSDLSGISDDKDLFITDAVHKAYVSVTEEGTEAAAATGITIGVTSAPPAPKSFIAEHPFIFLIRDMKTGSLLFMGRVLDPASRGG